MMMIDEQILAGSFRDPSGFVFRENGTIYRQVNAVYRDHYDHLMQSGLYGALLKSGLVVSHTEVGLEHRRTENAYKVLRAETVPFISYPYEWCFGQLKDAALTTLRLQKIAFKYGMTLKDSSAYNIQFCNACPVLIDLLSFERWQEGQLWTPYRQFCQHFLAPLSLMSKTDIRLNQLLRIYIDGIPLDLASSLLPRRTRLQFALLAHVHLHARSQKRYADKTLGRRTPRMSKIAFLGLIDSLEAAVRKLKWEPKGTEWANYYEHTNYSSVAIQAKKKIISEFIDHIHPDAVWDLGANTGVFSRIASDRGIKTLAFDVDPAAVEICYRNCKDGKEANLLPLVLDLTSPSPSIGWHNQERASLIERRDDRSMVFALALIHHLAISNNVPLLRIAESFSELCSSLIIEFVPKSDSQVTRLLATREDVFPEYTVDGFEKAFSVYFRILRSEKVGDTERTLFLMEKIRGV